VLCHLLFLEGVEASVGLVNVSGYGYVFRITGVGADGSADVRCNPLLGRVGAGEEAN
jgi:hypothetical protein